MTNAEIIEAAAKLGIKPTRAAVGSEVWQCWADRVREAQTHETDLQAVERMVGAKNRVNARALIVPKRLAAIAEANRYAA